VKLRTVIQPSMIVQYQLTAVGSGMEWFILFNILTYWTMWQLHFAFVFERNRDQNIKFCFVFAVSLIRDVSYEPHIYHFTVINSRMM
jgi:hypothetical protein